MAMFQVKLRKRNITDDELISDLRRCASELLKNSLTSVEYAAKGEFGVNTFLRRFKSWNLALEKAGLNAPNRQNVSEIELFENIANVWASIGHQPYGRELDKTLGFSEFSVGTYENRFGSWNKALLAFQEFINTGVIPDVKAPLQNISESNTKRTSRKINWRLRAQVLIRDNCICQMCGASPSKNPNVQLHADHIKPWSKGGETVLENLRTLCLECNIGKSDMHHEDIT